MTFYPKDYIAPRSESSYTKLQEGETKIRILSSPIFGWEDWKDQKPMRFKVDQKPLAPVDPAKKIKYFLSMVIYNYTTDQIEIFHITQKSIQNELDNLILSEDWGEPFNYDIKITRKGEGINTEYGVYPVPHKPLLDSIKEKYKAKPINLEAIFTNDDPFAPYQSKYTIGFFDQTPAASNLITHDQVDALQELLDFDPDYKRNFMVRLNKSGFLTLHDITLDMHDKIYNQAKRDIDAMKEAELATVHHEGKLPF